MVAMYITSEKRKRVLLLHYAGTEVDKIFDTLDQTGDDEEYKPAVDALTKYFNPRRNKAEVYKFRQAKQESNETLDTFHTRLRQLFQTCE